MTMMTLCIRYRFNPDRIADVREYFETEQRVIERSGGKILGYFLPTDFAGPTNEAMGLIDFPSLSAYEQYRDKLANDPDDKKNIARLAQSGGNVTMARSLIQRIGQNEANRHGI